jgi:hypothetical protein
MPQSSRDYAIQAEAFLHGVRAEVEPTAKALLVAQAQVYATLASAKAQIEANELE